MDTISKKKQAQPKKKKGGKNPPQPPAKKNKNIGAESAAKNNKRKRTTGEHDDAPRAFKRLMAFASGKQTRSGLDDPTPATKKKGKESGAAETGAEGASEVPTLRPGERLSEFNQRVNAALPIGGLVNKSVRNGKDPLGLKVWRTKKEMQMHKLYDEWREEDRKIKEKREEDLEEAEEAEMENENAGVSWKLEDAASASGKKKKRKGGKLIGEVRGAEEDPWEAIKRNRGETRISINDVAQAPPELTAPPKKFTVRGAAVDVDNIPKAAGSLRQREELQGIREEFLSSYRKMMNKKRQAL